MNTPHNTPLGGAGWAGVDKVLKEYGVQNRFLNVPKAADMSAPEVIVQFLEDEPYVKFKAHSVKEGYVSCFDDDCPLCKANHKNRKGAGLNVLLMTHEGYEVRTLAVTGRELDTITNFLKNYPRGQWYFNLKVTSVGITPFPVKPEEMEQDWGIKPPAAGYVPDSTALFTDSPIVTVSRREMAGLASKIVDKRELLKKNTEASPLTTAAASGSTMADRLKAMTR